MVILEGEGGREIGGHTMMIVAITMAPMDDVVVRA